MDVRSNPRQSPFNVGKNESAKDGMIGRKQHFQPIVHSRRVDPFGQRGNFLIQSNPAVWLDRGDRRGQEERQFPEPRRCHRLEYWDDL